MGPFAEESGPSQRVSARPTDLSDPDGIHPPSVTNPYARLVKKATELNDPDETPKFSAPNPFA